MTDPLYFSTAPVFSVDGTVKGELARDLLRLEVEEDTAGLRTLMASFIAQGPQSGEAADVQLYLDGAVLDFGRRLSVSIGPPDGARRIFDGVISALEADFAGGRVPRVAVFAEDALMKLRMTRRSRTWEQMSDADIASEIAGLHGLAAAADADGPTWDVVQQWNQSDLAFLRERARLIGAEIWCADDTLHFATRDQRTATELTLVQGGDLLGARLRADLAHQRLSVKVGGFDAGARERIDEEGAEDAVQAEVSGGRTGIAVLGEVFSEAATFRVREVPLETAEARAIARAELLRRARRFVTVGGTTRGTPDLMVGSRLRLERVGPPFEGDGYYVTRVRHTYDLTDGHRTHFEAERATIGVTS